MKKTIRKIIHHASINAPKIEHLRVLSYGELQQGVSLTLLRMNLSRDADGFITHVLYLDERGSPYIRVILTSIENAPEKEKFSYALLIPTEGSRVLSVSTGRREDCFEVYFILENPQGSVAFPDDRYEIV